MKRVLLLATVLNLLVFSVSLAADRLRIAYSSISAAYTGIWVAHDAGFFAKEGIDDQIILIPSGTQLAQVTVAGDVEIASLGGGPVIAAVLNGADLTIIGNNVNKLIFSLHTKPEVKTIEDLRGKRIAVSRFGSSSDVAARHALRKVNLDLQKDVILMQLGSMSNMFGALKSGAVEASMVSPPTQFLSEKMGFKELLSVTDMDIAYPNPAMVVSGDLIRRRANIIDRFMRAYVRAIQRARADRESTIRTLAKYTTVTDAAVARQGLRLLHEQSPRARSLHQHAGDLERAGRRGADGSGGEKRQARAVRRPAFPRQTRKKRLAQRALQIKVVCLIVRVDS